MTCEHGFPRGHCPLCAPSTDAMAVEVRRVLQRLGSDGDRREALILAAICPNCGKDHSEFSGVRGFWSCDCEESYAERDGESS